MSDASSLAIISQQINELHNKIKTLFKGFGIFPIPNSIAQNELDTQDAEMVTSVHSHGLLLIDVASNNLVAFAREITGPVLAYAITPNIRVILEVASTSIWLLDINIDVDERVRRYCVLRYRALTQLKRWAVAANKQDAIKKAEKRLDDAINKAKEKGIKTKENKKGEIFLEKPMPGFTNMVSSQLHKEGTYELLSAMTHANNWALLAHGYIIGPDIPHGKIIKRTINIELINYLASIGINGFQKQIICTCNYFGWPIEGIEATFVETKNNLPRHIEF